LPVSASEEQQAISQGARKGPKGGIFIAADGDLAAFEPWLPFYAREFVEPLCVDLIPSTSWGGSLANLLTASSWDKLRQPALSRTNGVCVVCGLAGGNGKAVHCHEVWEYHLPLAGEIGAQKLVGILPVCKLCHEMFHLGRAAMEGRLDRALSRLAWANRWSAAEVDACHRYAGTKWRERSQRLWTLDLSMLGAEAKLSLKGGATGVRVDGEGNLRYESSQGAGVTRLTGAPFTSGGVVYGPFGAPDYRKFRKDV